MSDRKMTVVHSESDEAAGQIVVGFLKSHGIEAVISEDDAGDQLPSLEAVRGVHVFVPVEEAERARRLLADRESPSGAD